MFSEQVRPSRYDYVHEAIRAYPTSYEREIDTMNHEELNEQYTKRANAELNGGGSIEIDRTFGTIAITMSSGEEWYFDEGQADELLADVPEWADPENYLLAQVQNW